ncbi:MAG: hypothetical protein J2P27_05480, partial [Actinobacteria bacterium]|nr:hypothetical protein [Actinomycetota bacterium]
AQADRLRRSIKAGECYCPLANAAYTNMLAHGPTVTRVAADVARSRAKSLTRRPTRGKKYMDSGTAGTAEDTQGSERSPTAAGIRGSN